MSSKRTMEDTIRQYIFGQLTEPERLAFEDEYLSRDDTFDQLLAVEHELIDAYVAGELNAGQRYALEKTSLSSGDRDRKLAFSSALMSARRFPEAENAPLRTVSDTRSRGLAGGSAVGRWLDGFFGIRWVTALAAILLVCVAYWVTKKSGPGRIEPALTVVLTSGSRSVERSTEATPVPALHPGNHPVHLNLRFDRSPYQVFRVEVRPASGEPVATQSGLRAQPRVAPPGDSEDQVSLTLPPRSLRPGLYTLILYGLKPGGGWDKLSGYSLQVD